MPNTRVLAIVSRGTGGPHIETTHTEIWEHEIPLLEQVHGGRGSVKVIRDDDDLLDDQDPKSKAAAIASMKLARGLGDPFIGRFKETRDKAGNVINREPITVNPKNEFDRCEAKYGMHPKVNQSVVSAVYGDYGSRAFIDALKNGYETADVDFSEPEDLVVEEAQKKKAAA